jgi:hypothetical protein
MLKTKWQSANVEVTVAVQCNLCGEEFPVEADDGLRAQEVHLLEAEGGFAGVFPPDLIRFRWHCCGPCLRKWLHACAVPPESFERSLSIGNTLRPISYDTWFGPQSTGNPTP